MNNVEKQKQIENTKRATTDGKMLGTFLAISFGLTWGLAILFFMIPDVITKVFGEVNLSNPIVILAIYAPGIAGVLLVLRYYGLSGFGKYLKRMTLWRAPISWWGFLLLGIPVVVFIGALIKGTVNTAFPFSPWTLAIPAIGHALILGPLEEFGWRGFALPLLQRKFAPFWAGLILGVIWALWHVPSLFMSGMPQSSWDVIPYFLGIIAICVILTALFNDSRGSLLISVIYHFQMMNPLWPDAQPYDNFLFVLLAIVVVIINRKKMFTRQGSITEILIAAEK